MASFSRAKASLSCRYKNKATHGGNHAPSASDWFKNDDTLDRQGVSKGKPNGHGICKGTASAWVIAFLNGVKEASDASRYEAFYTDFLRYQATMIKDFGKHIDSHVSQLGKLGVQTHVEQIRQFKAVRLTKDDLPSRRWGTYISVWHHDIAAGGEGRRFFGSRKFYIVEPNTGLLGYDSQSDMLADLNEYIESRRTKKGLDSTAEAGFWLYGKDD